ncbi:hypothetical protein VOLCADRAFT_103571 [Volvox carteri f. nagariensis]|uniref:Uncharacterized protein n=1 Tax=Volvox carteri f. nagariensis TaxID=3068 RepID=D8TMW2_VOLCA|nr:uncharacterized protein VOLCADRAFT_103571 [Volvox carteri f. nagariensis]EFJ51197.1 hypothetical protein VOLCADRAFT_103571 [Volvox carteri f. nagariensis]|eukprot:XP_002947664.1 hypothetical protein VOLCADRAFT_103571 [Volvox carteri f. nagariensis]
MLTRRSESCPRLARKDSLQQAQPLAPLSTPPSRSCTLQDLGPEDRQKVAKLLKQVVDLGQDVQQLKLQRDERKAPMQFSYPSSYHICRLKRKLAQVAALEATQQPSVQKLQCTTEVQTDPVNMLALAEARSSTASNVHAAPFLQLPPAIPVAAAQPAGHMLEPDGNTADNTAAQRASLVTSPSGPPFLHVAPGAHVNITINHVPEPAAVTAAAVASGSASGAVTTAANPAGRVGALAGNSNKNIGILEAGSEAEPTQAISPAHSPQRGCIEGAASTLAALQDGCTASENGSVNVTSPAAPAMIAIPTTTAAASVVAATSSVIAVGPRSEAAMPEVSTGSCTAVGAPASTSDWVRAAASWSVQQQAAAAGREAHDYGLGMGTVPRAPPRPATAAASGPSASMCGKPAGPRCVLVDATMQRFEAVPVHEVRVDSREVLTASPMIVPPCDEVVAAASRLLGWQVQHGFAAAAEEGSCAGSAPSTSARDSRSGRKVLSYDPAIGQSGAFYFVDVPDVAGEQVGGLGGPTQPSGRPPIPPPCVDMVASVASTPATERARGSGSGGGPQLASCQTASIYEAEATLRQWSDTHDAVPAIARVSGSAPATTQQHQHAHAHAHPRPHPHQQHYRHQLHKHPVQQLQHQQELLVLERPTPASPCSSYTTDTTITMMTPSMPHGMQTPPPVPGYNETPASSSMSLSRMAMALDEMARRQRWDVQPPGCVAQQQEQQQHEGAGAAQAAPPRASGNGSHVVGPGAGHMRLGALGHGGFGVAAGPGPTHGCRKLRDSFSVRGPLPAQQQQHLHGLRHGSGVSAAAAAATLSATGAIAVATAASSPLHSATEAAVTSMDAMSTCGSSTHWFGGCDVAERYDDSLVDILSQADEELEYQQQQQPQRWRRRPHSRPHRLPSQPAAAKAAPVMPARLHAASAVVAEGAGPLLETVPTRAKLHAASAEALLAANLYEENDVFSVILEQEGQA